jgi:hypothetical protein
MPSPAAKREHALDSESFYFTAGLPPVTANLSSLLITGIP